MNTKDEIILKYFTNDFQNNYLKNAIIEEEGSKNEKCHFISSSIKKPEGKIKTKLFFLYK